MTLQITAIVIGVAVFALSAYRHIHVGILMFAAAGGVGIWLADMPIKAVIGEFPISMLVLLAGVTYFFGVAQANGTVDKIIERSLARVGDRTALLPGVFFLLTTGIASMGSPGGALVVIPIGMKIAQKRRIDPMLMGLAMGTGISAGAFAPTSLFGIVTYSTANAAGIDMNPLLLFIVSIAVNVGLLVVAHMIFGTLRRFGRSPKTLQSSESTIEELVTVSSGGASTISGSSGAKSGRYTPPTSGGSGTSSASDADPHAEGFTLLQKITGVSVAALFILVIATSASGLTPDIGMIGFAFGAFLALLDPKSGREGIARIDWSTILLVGGIITYVGVLENLGALDMIGDLAAGMSVPLLAALTICFVGGLLSAFASTTGMLAALVPLAVPLVATGGIPGWAMICALAICASIVDVSPFSTVGATIVATTPDPDDHNRVTRLLTRWGLSLVVIGPIAMVALLVAPSVLL
ncbi:SLC13 family permease [Actinomycetes bacterium M1A6_2h]